MAIVDALPYGLRDVKLTPYTDDGGTVLGTVSYDLPNSQTFTFNETEEFQELRGDDRLVATHGSGAKVDWSLEAGGISLTAWSILTGGAVIVSGITPNRVEILRKKGSDVRPYFRVDGQVISDSGGDIVARVYRCKCNDTVGGDFGDGQFFTTSVSGTGLPLLDDTNDLLYDIVRNETKTSLNSTPTANPLQTPSGLSAASITSSGCVLSWNAVTGATSYRVQRSTDAGATWTDVATDPTSATKTITGLTTATSYRFRVAAVISGVLSSFSDTVTVTTS